MKNAVKGIQSPRVTTKAGFLMANCCYMYEGDLYHCNTCGLELEVEKPAPAIPIGVRL
jgi:hypothetical protein